jgi:uncharacterized membrane protein
MFEPRVRRERPFHPAKAAKMLALKTFHIIAAILWLGNFVVTGVWSARAFASRDRALQAFATREIIFTDIIFTVFGAAAVIGSGMGLAALDGIPAFSTLWTRDALITAIGSGIVWLVVLFPLELRMRKMAQANDASIMRTFAIWSVVGIIVTVLLLAVVYLMVAKPV